MKRRAFTLIELLVVVAIISILASILFPVFARVRENARKSGCLSNLKQLGLGVMMYVQDYDSTYPSVIRYTRGVYDGDHGTDYSYWYRDIQPYVKEYRSFTCPSSSQGYGGSEKSYDWNQSNHGYVQAGNYGGNILVMKTYNERGTAYDESGHSLGTQLYPYVNQASIVSATTMYLLMDAGAYMADPYMATTANGGYLYLPGTGSVGATATAGDFTERYRNDFERGRHFGGINMAFADGHVKWLSALTVRKEALKLNNNGSPWQRYRMPSHPVMKKASAWNPWVDNSQ